jgi:type II secretory pathway pseudopilin PulG
VTTVLAVSTLGLILLIVLAIVVVLAAGGYMAMTRRTQTREAALKRELAHAEDALAQAHALDKGWDRATLEAAAVAAAAERFGPGAVGKPQLVQVIDQPGVDADEAVFRFEGADGKEHRITLGRAGGEWGPA